METNNCRVGLRCAQCRFPSQQIQSPTSARAAPAHDPLFALCKCFVCDLLFNTEPSTIAVVYRSPSIPPPDNISLICTLDTIISRRSDCILLGDFNCPKVNWASNAAPPNKVDSQLLNFYSVSLLHQCVLNPTRFRVNQHPSLLDLIFVKFPHLIYPISVHPLLGKSDHAVLCWTYTSTLPQLPPRPEKINPASVFKQLQLPLQKPTNVPCISRIIHDA